MAKYTLELRELFSPIRFNPPLFSREEVEGWFKDYELTDFLTPEQIEVIENAGIWSKDKLATKIIDHYYMREIGFETPMLFKHYAKVEMQEIMEEYAPLIYTNCIKYDPLVNVDFTEEFTKSDSRNRTDNSTGQNSSTSSSSASSLGVNSDTPQSEISKTEILAGKYASSTGATESTNSITDSTSSSSSNTGQETGSENWTRRTIGNSGSLSTAQKLIEQYRNNIRAIDKDIIKRLNYLFMGLY